MRAEHGGGSLLAAAGGQDTGGQVQDIAGHLAVPGGPADGVVQEAVPHAHCRVGLQQVRGQLLFLPGRRCRVTGVGGAGERLGKGVQLPQDSQQVSAEAATGAPHEAQQS